MRNLKSDNLYRQVYREIRRYIVDNKLSTGDKLPSEMELCAALGVSRNVLRESLKALQLMGVVEPQPGVGYIIQSFQFDNLFENIIYNLIDDTERLWVELHELRSKLELAYLDEALDRMGPEDIAALHKATMELVRYQKQREQDPCAENMTRESMADEQFHRVIYGSFDNSMFQSILRVTWDMEERLFIYGDLAPFNLPGEDPDQHVRIYEAIAQGDRGEVRRLMRRHFENNMETIRYVRQARSSKTPASP